MRPCAPGAADGHVEIEIDRVSERRKIEPRHAPGAHRARGAGRGAPSQTHVARLRTNLHRHHRLPHCPEGACWNWVQGSASLLGEIFTATGRDGRTGEPAIRDGDGTIPRPAASPHQKLVIFTEHRDTLRYLQERITTLLGRQTSVVVIHGSVGREDRLAAQEAFRHDPQVQVLLATDAEILYSLNKPDDFILALVLFGSGGDDTPRVRYVRRPFQREPDFGAASVNYWPARRTCWPGGRQVRPGAPEQP